MEDNRILGLLKFGKIEYLEQFVNGRLYMNTLDYFANLEEQELEELRGDSFEGVGAVIPATGGTLSIKIGDDFQSVGDLHGAIKWWPTDGIKANVFCMYGLRFSEGPAFVDTRNLRFGDAFAAVVHGDEFLRRVRKAASITAFQYECAAVGYFDENIYEGPVGIFRKRKAFEYQSEVRIALTPGTGAPYMLEVGDLSDIIQIGPLTELNQRLRVAKAAP